MEIIPLRRATTVIGMSAFVCVTLCGKECDLLIDSGAAVTVISIKLWTKLPVSEKPELTSPNGTIKLEAANNELIPVKGIATVNIHIGDQSFEWEVYVADIDDDGILGYDFLYYHDCNLSARQGLTIGGRKVKCKINGVPNVNKVTLAHNTTIPAYSECVVQGNVINSSVKLGKLAMIEPVEIVRDSTADMYDGLILGRTLIDTRTSGCGNDLRVPVRVLNMTTEDIELRANMNIGYLHEVESVVQLDKAEYSDMDQACRTYSICKLHQVHGIHEVEGGGDCASGKVPHNDWCVDLQKLYERAAGKWDDTQAKTIEDLLNKHESTFARSADDYGRTKVIQHSIDTGNAKPVRQPPRRPPKAFEAEEEEIIEKQLKAGVIQESTSPWASPLVFVRKKDGTTRCCVDYRLVNKVTEDSAAWVLPKVGDCLDCLDGAKLFSTLDLQAGYWQIEVKPEDRPKTAFISSRRGLYEYITMPFGLCNAPSTFQRCMELVMKGLQWKTLLIYLDDVIIYSSTFDEHIKRLDEALTRLGDAGLKLKPSKCELFQESVVFLGHLVTPEGVKPDPGKVEAVHTWPIPRNVTGVRAFLGLCSYYRRFIRGFAHIAAPLNRLLEAGKVFDWNDDCQEAFETLKSKLTGDELMSYPDNEGLYILDTDASNTGIGATLSQLKWCEEAQQHVEKPIAYASLSMTKTQRRYCTTRRELLAIVTFTHKFRYYLLGRRFLIRTDHSALRWLISFKEPTDQMARWLELLTQYNFHMEHRAGKKHGNADALSRRDCDPEECDCYDRNTILTELPCGGCDFCVKKHEAWSDFFEVDDVVPLFTRPVKALRSDRKFNHDDTSISHDYTARVSWKTVFTGLLMNMTSMVLLVASQLSNYCVKKNLEWSVIFDEIDKEVLLPKEQSNTSNNNHSTSEDNNSDKQNIGHNRQDTIYRDTIFATLLFLLLVTSFSVIKLFVCMIIHCIQKLVAWKFNPDNCSISPYYEKHQLTNTTTETAKVDQQDGYPVDGIQNTSCNFMHQNTNNNPRCRTIFSTLFCLSVMSSFMVLLHFLVVLVSCCEWIWKSTKGANVLLTGTKDVPGLRIWKLRKSQCSGEAIDSDKTRKGSTSSCCDEHQPTIKTAKSVKTTQLDGYDIAKLQREDPDISKIITWMSTSTTRPDKDEINLKHEGHVTRHLYLLWSQLRLVDGVLYKAWEPGGKSGPLWQLVVPKSLQATVMQSMHNSITSGHLGVHKTYKKISRCFYWHNMKNSVSEWIRRCKKCNVRKRPQYIPRAPLGDIKVGAPMDRLDTDILGPLPITDTGMRYILLVQDQFTKWTECYAIADQTAETVAHKIVYEFISRFGTPLALHSDQGRNYESHLFKQVCNLLEIEKVHCTPWHPQANGSVEKFNQVLLNMLSMYVDKNQKDWDKYLPLLTSAYRSCDHVATGYSPNLLMLGRETIQPIELILGRCDSSAEDTDESDYVAKLREKMTQAHKIVRSTIQQDCNRQKRDFDTSRNFNKYEQGGLVYVRTNIKKKGLSPKLQPNWEGPFIIVRKISDLIFEIRSSQAGRTKVIHHDRLKPCVCDSDIIPTWMKTLQNRLQVSRNDHAENDSGNKPVSTEIGIQVDFEPTGSSSTSSTKENETNTPQIQESLGNKSSQKHDDREQQQIETDAAEASVQNSTFSGTHRRKGLRQRKKPARYADFDMSLFE